MTAFRVAMPNSVTKPTSEPRLSSPPVANTASTPPTSANGRLASTRSSRLDSPNATHKQHHDAGRREQAVAEQLAPRGPLRGAGAADLGIDARRQHACAARAAPRGRACTPSGSRPRTLAVTVCTRRAPTCAITNRPVVRAMSATCAELDLAPARPR